LSDHEEVKLTSVQFQEWEKLTTAQLNALWRIAEVVVRHTDHQRETLETAAADLTKWLAIQNETISAGFASVVEAIAKLQTPLPPPQRQMKGTVMADYSIPDDQPDGRVTFNLSATDSEGQSITDPAVLATLQFELSNTNEDAFQVTLDADQPEPSKRVGGYHVGAPGQAAVTGNLKDADGNIIGTGTDGFTVTTGKVALGSVGATFDGLTPIGG